MRCCLVTLSREAFKPSQFSEADVLSQRLFSLEKILKEGKLNLTDIGFIFLLGQTNDNWENAEVFTNLYKEE